MKLNINPELKWLTIFNCIPVAELRLHIVLSFTRYLEMLAYEGGYLEIPGIKFVRTL